MIYPRNYENKVGFHTVRESVRSYCSTPIGQSFCDDMMFMTDYKSVKTELDATAEMLAIIHSDDSLMLGSVHDVTHELKRLSLPGTYMQVAEIAMLRRTIDSIAQISTFFHGDRVDDDLEGSMPYPVLSSMTASLSAFPGVARGIDRILDKFGNIKDNASPELAGIRRALSAATGSVNSVMRRVLAQAVQAGYLEPDTSPAMRDGRLVIPVASMHKRRINGIVHDESASGKTFFIEPAELVETNNRIRELQIEERHEIVRILTSLADEIRPHIPDLLDNYSILGKLDFINAKAVYASETGGKLPVLVREPDIEWYHACHPVLLLSLQNQGKIIVPLDITLTSARRLLIVSGPNAGGKSVTLKTVGVIQYMTQCGMLPPLYENSRMGLFDDIFIDIGDDQSIENDLSTYSSHLRNMKQFVTHGRNTTLVLIDEFGGGTEPQIGGAIAQAILKQFNNAGMWGIITTHYQNLKKFADETDGLINGSMLYDRQLMQPLFRLSIGNPGSSFAIEIARKTGLPDVILRDAEEIVGSDYINLDKYLLDIARDRRYWENKRQSIRQKEKKLEQLMEQYQADADTLRQKRREILEDAKEEAKKLIGSTNARIERTIHEIRIAQAEKEKTMEARRKLKEAGEALASVENDSMKEPKLLRKVPNKRKAAESTPQQTKTEKRVFVVGDHVKLDGQGTPGTVLSVSGDNITVNFGVLHTTVKSSRLSHTMAKPQSGAGKTSFISSDTISASRERQLHFKQEIDVRGMRADEALQSVTYFIDDALQFNAHRVRILHGTGTGALRQAIRAYLSTVNGVKYFADEDVRFGGAGITVVEI